MAGTPYHPAVADVLGHFAYDHLPVHLQVVSKPICELAHQMAAELDGPQLTIGLQDLLRAKDAFVRAAVRPQIPAAKPPAKPED
jgi:hypothetical protein